ncbi:Hpt sensor hybrid histidine kinase, partial [Thauera phenylacetica B4P]
LGVDVPLVRDRLAALRSPHVEAALRERLQSTGDRLAAGLEGMSAAIAERLRLRAARVERIDALRKAIDALDELARIHADNATAQLVATLTTLLQPDPGLGAPGQGAPSLAEREATRERVLDLDIDSLERMHELELTVHALGFLVGRLDELDSNARLQAARAEFAEHLALLARRLADIPDPGGREQGRQVHQLLASALEDEGAFALRARELALRAQVETLQGVVGELTTELDALAGELIHRGGRILAAAGSAAERSATSGLIAFGVIAAALLLVTLGVTVHALRRHTLGRLRALEEATLALASGRREVAIDTTGDDELASLAVALERFRANAIERDRLAEALRGQQQELENQVLA